LAQLNIFGGFLYFQLPDPFPGPTYYPVSEGAVDVLGIKASIERVRERTLKTWQSIEDSQEKNKTCRSGINDIKEN
jgi:hypothetical protein